MRPLNVTDGHPAVCACGPCADSAVNAMIQEGSDAAAGTATSYRMSVGDSFKGNLAWIGDRDWVAIELSAGDHYEFGLSGQASGAGTLGDPYLRLYDSSGLLVVDNDDGGVGFDSLLTYTANRSGTYYIAAGSYADRWTGTYTMTADSTALPEPGGFSDLADYLVNGFWEWFGQSARQWNTSVSNVVTVDIGGLTAEGQQLARWAMEAWEYVIDIDFREDDSNAMLVFDDEEDGAYSVSVVSGGYIQSSLINISADWLASYGTSLDSYSFQTYVHELGHSIGLGHQGAYNGWANYPEDATFLDDSWQASIMSYFSQTENTTIDASYAYVMTPMIADVLAVQEVYGASEATAGNTVYGADSNVGGYLGVIFDALQNGVSRDVFWGGPAAMTITDSGGVDTIDFSFSDEAQRLDLRAGTYSNVVGLTGNLGIALGTTIENGRTGAGNDTLIGNAVGNTMTAGSGNDFVDGGAGTDTAVLGVTRASATVSRLANGDMRIVSAEGTDTFRNVEYVQFTDQTVLMSDLVLNWIMGTEGADNLRGIASRNFIEGMGGNDRIYGNASADRLFGGGGNDEVHGYGGDDLIYGGDGEDYLSGGVGNDVLSGEVGNDRLFGGGGNDLLRGGGQNDTLDGGTGNDRLYGDGGDDRLWGRDGNDTLYGGDGADSLHGHGGNDIIYGDGGNDYMSGAAGNDVLAGGLGSDRLFGGSGNDLLRGGGNDDFLSGDDGDDTIYGDNGSDTSSGGSGNDRMYGGEGNDELHGDAGNDIIYGEAGDDYLSGGAGDDVAAGDVGDDRLFGGAGNDILRGGGHDDALDGGDGDDRLYGDNGNDRISGGNGNDLAFGGDGSDSLHGYAGGDFLDGGRGDDYLSGGSGDDTLDGGAGDDILAGGSGADTFVFTGGGADTVLDFYSGEGDRIELDDGLWGGGGTVDDVLADYGGTNGDGAFMLAFGDGDSIVFDAITSASQLRDHIDIV